MDLNDKNLLSDDMLENVIGGFMLIPDADLAVDFPAMVGDFIPDVPPLEPVEPIFPTR